VTELGAFGNAGSYLSGQRNVAALVVFLGHLMVLLLAWQWKLGPTRLDEARRAVTLQLIASSERASSTGAERAPALARTSAHPNQESRPIKDANSGRNPQAPSESMSMASTTTLDTDGKAQHQAGQHGGSATTPSATPLSPAALTLKPNRDVLLGSLSNPATEDPRSNSPKPTFEERIAMGLDPELCIKLERFPDGTIRRRMSRLVNAQSAIQNTHGTGPQGIKVCQ
jgi:hypothetical protein